MCSLKCSITFGSPSYVLLYQIHIIMVTKNQISHSRAGLKANGKISHPNCMWQCFTVDHVYYKITITWKQCPFISFIVSRTLPLNNTITGMRIALKYLVRDKVTISLI